MPGPIAMPNSLPIIRGIGRLKARIGLLGLLVGLLVAGLSSPAAHGAYISEIWLPATPDQPALIELDGFAASPPGPYQLVIANAGQADRPVVDVLELTKPAGATVLADSPDPAGVTLSDSPAATFPSGALGQPGQTPPSRSLLLLSGAGPLTPGIPPDLDDLLAQRALNNATLHDAVTFGASTPLTATLADREFQTYATAFEAGGEGDDREPRLPVIAGDLIAQRLTPTDQPTGHFARGQPSATGQFIDRDDQWLYTANPGSTNTQPISPEPTSLAALAGAGLIAGLTGRPSRRRSRPGTRRWG